MEEVCRKALPGKSEKRGSPVWGDKEKRGGKKLIADLWCRNERGKSNAKKVRTERVERKEGREDWEGTDGKKEVRKGNREEQQRK